MAFVNPSTPNLADFTTFVYDQGVTTAVLPTDSVYLGYAFEHAFNSALTPPSDLAPIIYVIAVYDLGMHRLIKITQDVSGSTYFKVLRINFRIGSFLAGVLASSSDEGTSGNLDVASPLKNLMLSDLDLLKTPYGRDYLAYAQTYGPTVWGIS